MILYITPAGKTASRTNDFLKPARDNFKFDKAIILTDLSCIIPMYERMKGEKATVIALQNPFFGTDEYIPTVRKVLKLVAAIEPEPELIVINSSGGTEKQTCIIKDIANSLSLKYNVKRVWGIFYKTFKEPVFTENPEINYIEEMDNAIKLVASIKELKDHDSPLDINKNAVRPGI